MSVPPARRYGLSVVLILAAVAGMPCVLTRRPCRLLGEACSTCHSISPADMIKSIRTKPSQTCFMGRVEFALQPLVHPVLRGRQVGVQAPTRSCSDLSIPVLYHSVLTLSIAHTSSQNVRCQNCCSHRDFDSADSVECNEQAASMILVFGATWQVMGFSVCFCQTPTLLESRLFPVLML